MKVLGKEYDIIYDKTGDKKALMKILRTHTEHFFEGYVENKEGNNE